MVTEIKVVHVVTGEIKTFAGRMYAHKFLINNKEYLILFD
jgi:hypothetical protein